MGRNYVQGHATDLSTCSGVTNLFEAYHCPTWGSHQEVHTYGDRTFCTHDIDEAEWAAAS